MAIQAGRTTLALFAAAGAAAIAGVAWFNSDRQAVPVAAPEVAVAVGPAEPAAQATTPAPDVAVVVPQAPPEPRTAAFDEVRREEDGMTIIAGRGEPGASVQVLLDADVITATRADTQGKFVAITMIAPDGQGHVLSLLQIVDGQEYPSDNQIILAPLDPPVVVAEATPEDEQEAPTEPVGAEPSPAIETDVVLNVPQTSQAPVEIADAPDAGNDAALPEPVARLSAETSTAQEPGALSAPAIDTAESSASADPAPRPTLQAAAPGEGAVAAPQASETAAAEQINIAAQDAEPKTKTAQPVVDGRVGAPEPQPTPDSPAPKPQVAVLKATQEGVELLNVPRPEALENVALDTISYSDAGEVQLTGRAQSDTRHVQVYLDNAAVVTLSVDDQGRWRGGLPDVDEGIYTLRVDEVAQDGRVTSRVETPFKREDPEVLAEVAARTEGPLKQITVQKGATLWAIAQERYGDGLLYVNVFQANADTIRDPDLIYPGQVFALPE